MKVGLHVAISGQLALYQQMESVAQNVANITTPGYRADGSRFSALVAKQRPAPVSYVSGRETYIVTEPGAIKATGNPLDVALRGDVWMALQWPDGIVYTRDGRMRMLPDGRLVSAANGWPVLDVGGAPIALKPKAGPPQIAADGMITQNGRQIGAIGLFRMPEDAKLTRVGNSGVIPNIEPEPVVRFVDAGVIQGFVEESNVNGAIEMVRLIEMTNAFRQLTSALNDAEEATLAAIRTLGDPGP